MENIGDRIRKRRLELELSQLALARRANVSQGTIAQLENGRNHGTGKIYEISIALNVSPEWLLYGKNPPSSSVKSSNLIGNDLFVTSSISTIGLKKEYIKSNNWDEDYIDFIQCKDESMSPTISIFVKPLRALKLFGSLSIARVKSSIAFSFSSSKS